MQIALIRHPTGRSEVDHIEFVIPIGAKGKWITLIRHPDRSEAKWRDMLFTRDLAFASHGGTIPKPDQI
jgi:hypothetical protein